MARRPTARLRAPVRHTAVDHTEARKATARCFGRSDRSAQRSDYRVWLALASPCCNQTGQALRDELPRPFDQLVDNLAGRLDLADQANALTR